MAYPNQGYRTHQSFTQRSGEGECHKSPPIETGAETWRWKYNFGELGKIFEPSKL